MTRVLDGGRDARAARVARFFDGNGRSYDWGVLLMSLGADPYWKRRIVAKVPPSRAILDLACGTGILTCRLARRHPGARITGVDLTEDFLRVARRKADRLGLNAEFVHANAETVPLPDSAFDCVVSSYIPKYVDAGRFLDNVCPSLRPGGTIILHDFTYPKKRVDRILWRGYLVLSRLVWPALFPGWRTVLAELPGLIMHTRWVEDFAAGLRARGFVGVQLESLTGDSGAILWARKGP
jgi:demethylmenaquinone methyltransferase/2-methoxy-6-polyprenyl-1,4-benzoquinol methylase